MDLVIVESPAKAKTINRYLGNGYEVVASYGHVRDLIAKDGSVDPDNNFDMAWQVSATSTKRLQEITRLAKQANKIILATDPDREGEAISWHLFDILTKKPGISDKKFSRVVFNAITKSAISEAMQHPKMIDDGLVNAYLARRALDYLVGFNLSPVLWRKLPGARSAGRVQSVALRLLCEREREIELFKSQEYWSIKAILTNADDAEFEAGVIDYNGNKISRLSINSKEEADEIRQFLLTADFDATRVDKKPLQRRPQPPFITSTLQQEAARKLGFAASYTMQLAQKLYEGVSIDGELTGLITYMRTDGFDLAPEAISGARAAIEANYGSNYLPPKAMIYKSKLKNAQEAHEAIRPTNFSLSPAKLKTKLDRDLSRLYDLIWRRGVACQMVNARLERTTINIAASGDSAKTVNNSETADNGGSKRAELRASGTIVAFAGFLKAYQETSADDSADDNGQKLLPDVTAGDRLGRKDVVASQHFTEPPPRYSEASLIKKMEELGIGRPSTYTSTLSVLQDRDYVRLERKRLIPEGKGRLVVAFLENFFNRYVEYDFTADLEEKLDLISDGALDRVEVLTNFWSGLKQSIEIVRELRITNVIDALNEALASHIFAVDSEDSDKESVDPRQCPKCGAGQLSIKIGKFGAFIGCSNYPECNFTRQLGLSAGKNASDIGADVNLGQDPVTQSDIWLKSGRFGPYVETEVDGKPKRVGLPRDWQVADVKLDAALQLLSLPRKVGVHPETGAEITAAIGRYGPFIKHQNTYGKLAGSEEVFSIGLNRAVNILADSVNKTRGSSAIKDLGEHNGKQIGIYNGRYGPYIKSGRINAPIPKGTQPEDVSLAQAIEILEAKSKKKAKKTAKKPAKKTAKKTSKTTGAKTTGAKTTGAKQKKPTKQVVKKSQ